MTTPLALLQDLIDDARRDHEGHDIAPVVFVDELEAALRRHPTAVVVCRHCQSANFTTARHGASVAADHTGEAGDIVCLWPCNHHVVWGEWRCGACYPGDDPPF
jgi:hypothetical protein